ncbi:MAG: hypothetical protein KAT16_09405 [Candidatus Heimdallarchaeota archaeon]|nr:hypothetical protein [Candidatus Heimdallarchaeota archaeon]
MAINPLKKLEQEYILLILQYLHLNPRGKTFGQISAAIEHDPNPKQVRKSIHSLVELGLIFQLQAEIDMDTLYVLSNRGRYASEIVWDLFRIILNPHDAYPDDKDILDFYR